MGNIIIINWIIGIVSILLVIYSSFIVYKASKRLSGELKNSILLLTSSFLILVFTHIIVGIFAVKNVDYQHIIWISVPILTFFGAILFVIGARKLFNVLLGVEGNSNKVKQKEVKTK